MKRSLVCLTLLAVMLVSCERRARVIPARTFSRIYAEMFLADQWLENNSQFKEMSDTTLFYESVFNHYGYTLDDYYNSVDYYMDHPDKFNHIVNTAVKMLQNMEENVPLDSLQQVD